MKLIKLAFILLHCTLLAGLLYLLSPKIVDFYDYVVQILAYPYVWALTENENMLFIKAFIAGVNPYQTTGPDYFYYFIYPPVFHILSAAVATFFGYSIYVPRLISLLSFLLLMGVMGSFFSKPGRQLENLLIAGILLGMSVSISAYSSYYILARVDMLAYLLAFTSLLFVWKIVWGRNERFGNYVMVGLTCLAALLTKQSVFFPYLVVVLVLPWAKSKQKWFWLLFYVGVSTLVVILSLDLVTKSGFGQNMIMAREIYGKYLNTNDHRIWLQTIFIGHYKVLLTSLAFLMASSIYHFFKKQPPHFSLVVFAAIYANFFITGGNRGAEYNTLIPLLLGLLLCLKEISLAGSTVMLRIVATSVFLVVVFYQLQLLKPVPSAYLTPSIEDEQKQAKLVSLLSESKSEWILGDRVDYAIILAGKKSVLEASTHNVALDWSATQAYAQTAQQQLLGRLSNGEITTAVLTITNFGKSDLYQYVTHHGTESAILNIRYVDAPGINHRVFNLAKSTELKK